jgi:hypothetical protein
MKRFATTTFVLACLTVTVVSGCVRTNDGVPVRAGGAPSTSMRLPTTQPTEDAKSSTPGVLPTTRAPIPPDAVTCSQPIKAATTMTAEVSDPAAPRITIAIPDGFSPSPGSGDVGARLDAPGGMWATVTIAPTQLDPAQAFTEYADRLMTESPVSSVSVMQGQLCGYSGQKLMGAWSDTPDEAVEFTDRLVHVWTNTKNYLVAVHVQAPVDTEGFDAGSSVLTEDFTVGIP